MTRQSWFYHVHKQPERTWMPPAMVEHGHFHTYIDTAALPSDAEPITVPRRPHKREDCVSHLVGLTVAMNGMPMNLFSMARRSSDEMMFRSDVLMPHVQSFWMRDGAPMPLVGRWVGAILRMFEPEVEWLLDERERKQRQENKHWLRSRIESLQPAVLAACRISIEERLQILEGDQR